jgi:putative Holliday junction resolvase
MREGVLPLTSIAYSLSRFQFSPQRISGRLFCSDACSSDLHSMADRLLLAFDFGTRRVGLAVGNTVTRDARPLATIDAQGEARWARIGSFIAQWQPAQLVVGVPRHPDGTPHEMTQRCEKFARQLEGRYRLPVVRVDERYSTTAAEGGRDDAAAAIILEQYLQEQQGVTVTAPAAAAATVATAASDQAPAAGCGQDAPSNGNGTP